jgi:hypothetical protein
VNGEVAGGLERVTDMQCLGAGKGRAVGFAGAHGFAEMVGPGFDGPDFDPAFRVGDVLVQLPVDGAGAAARIANFGHDGEEGFAVLLGDGVFLPFENTGAAI